MSDEKPDFTVIPGSDAREEPQRLLVVQDEAGPMVDEHDEPMVMSFPHLLARELVAFLVLSVGLVVISLAANAPLEQIANPTKTPNPAKAPWYFLGLQELLHYYPPIFSGVLLPGLLIVALAIIPYFRINLERPPVWDTARVPKLIGVWIVVAALTAIFSTTSDYVVWPLIGPLLFLAAVMTVSAFIPGRGRVGRWLRSRSMAFWIFTWFLLSAVTLTVIGVFFRGPSWSFTLPWRDGIYL